MTASRHAGRIRIGLAGAGWVTEHHLDAYRQLRDRAAVVAIADPRVEAAERRATEYGIPAVYRSVEEMLARAMRAEAPLDALDIAAPREHHVPIARLAARHGLAILCQKPLAPTLEEAEELVAALDDRTRLMVHENWRFRPHYRRAAGWLREGLIGEVESASLSVLTSGLLPDAGGKLPALERQPMLADLERMLLMEVMIHHVDTLRFLLGPLVLEAAELGKSCAQIRGEDRASLTLRTASGAPVSLRGDFTAPDHPPEQRDRLEIRGAAGRITLRDATLELRTGRGDGADRRERVALDLAADYKASYRGAIAHFLDRLADGGPFETGSADNLETLRIVEQAYRVGNRSGSVVR